MQYVAACLKESGFDEALYDRIGMDSARLGREKAITELVEPGVLGYGGEVSEAGQDGRTSLIIKI